MDSPSSPDIPEENAWPISRQRKTVGRPKGTPQRPYLPVDTRTAFLALMEKKPHGAISSADFLGYLQEQMAKANPPQRSISALQTFISSKMRDCIPECVRHHLGKGKLLTPAQVYFLKWYMKDTSFKVPDMPTSAASTKTPQPGPADVQQSDAQPGPSASTVPAQDQLNSLEEVPPPTAFQPTRHSTPQKPSTSKPDEERDDAERMPIGEAALENIIQQILSKEVEKIQEATLAKVTQVLKQKRRQEKRLESSCKRLKFEVVDLTGEEEDDDDGCECGDGENDDEVHEATVAGSIAPIQESAEKPCQEENRLDDSFNGALMQIVDSQVPPNELQPFMDTPFRAKLTNITVVEIFESSAETEGPFRAVQQDNEWAICHNTVLQKSTQWSTEAVVGNNNCSTEELRSIQRLELTRTADHDATLSPMTVEVVGKRPIVFERAQLRTNGKVATVLLAKKD